MRVKLSPSRVWLLVTLLLAGHINFAQQQKVISGKVTDDNTGQPIVGATVSVKGSTEATQSTSSGNFTITLPHANSRLQISSVGYEPQEISLGGKTNISVSLKTLNLQLNEVVVTALGIKKQKRALGYSTTDVAGSNFTQSRETNIGNALTGQVAGVSVAGDATGPYGSSRVIIRGNASLQGDNQPLYVIDGIPYDHSNQGSSGTWGGADFGDGLSNINPDDIENIQVLKGVAASALYGYRGGNGAILITTKSGAEARGIGVDVNNNFTASTVIDTRDYQYVYGQGSQGVKPETAAAANGSAESSWGAKIDGSYAVNFLGNTYKYSPAKDNLKNFYQTGSTNQTSVSLNASNDKGHFRLGLSNLYLGTIIPNSNMKQQGVNFNSTYNITRKLVMTLTANNIFEQVKNRASFSDAPANIIFTNLLVANTFDVRWLKPRVDANKNELLPGSDDIYFENPYFVAYNFQNTTERNRLTAGLTIKYNLLDWLFIQGQVTRDGYILNTRQLTPIGVQYSNNNGGSLSLSESNQRELNDNFLVGINKAFGSDFVLSANVGANSQDNIYKSHGMSGGPFTIPYFYSSNNISNRPFSYDYSHGRVNSVYGNIDLGYKNYLFLSATARNDWFSQLYIKTDHQLYPSVSGSFVFSDAFHMPGWINFGKLRASHAEGSNTGAANPYQNVLTYGLQGYTLNNQSLAFVNGASIPNAFLKPVSIKENEIGLNMEFLDNRLGFDVAVYQKKTTNDIVPVSISSTSGYTGNIINLGRLKNSGFEMLLTATPFQTKNFRWNISWNFAWNNSKVLDLGGAKSLIIDGAEPRNPDPGSGVNVSNVVGLPYGQIMGYGYKRDPNGSIIYNTDSLSGVVGEPLRTDDIIPLGSGAYKQTGGLTNELHYKNLSFSFLIDYKFGAKIFSGTNLILYSDGLHKNTLTGREGGYVGKGVTEDGKANTASVPAQTYFGDISGGSDHISEEFVYDASFIKLRSVSIIYSFPKSILKAGFIKGLSISLVGRNLAILLKHTPNIDPESNYNNSNGQGLELAGYPPTRNYGFNLNLKF